MLPKTTPEFISMVCHSVFAERNMYKKAEEIAQKCEFDFFDKNTGEIIPDDVAIEWMLSSGDTPYIKDSGCEAADDLFLSATLLRAHGHVEQAKKTMKHALYLLWQSKTEADRLSALEHVFSSARQRTIAKKPRNKHYDEVIRIAKATWEKYPAASKGQMCENLSKHFNGGVSADRIDVWIRNAGIQPPKPKKHTSFALVI